METKKVISSLCYFSVFFAPFLFPLVVYFVADNDETKRHAKSSFISHLIPLFTFFLSLFLLIPGIPFSEVFIVGGLFVVAGLFGIISFAVVVWNVVKGIKILMS